MKPSPAFLLFNLLVTLWISTSSVSVYAEPSVSLRYPPASLEQWYKPANKRQVWLHTMFRLRREMQAITEYASTDDKAAMKKWIKRLDKDYNKIAEMVPEWKSEIKPRLLDDLQMFAEKGDSYRTAKTLKMIKRTCDDCHTYFQPLATAMYRSPGYENITIRDNNGTQLSYEENMQRLSEAVNRIVIALDDGHSSIALQSSQKLAEQLQDLGASCNICHKDDEYPEQRILGKETAERFEMLQTNITAGNIKNSQKLMGEIAVTVCARCHNIHRIVNDLRNALLPEK